MYKHTHKYRPTYTTTSTKHIQKHANTNIQHLYTNFQKYVIRHTTLYTTIYTNIKPGWKLNGSCRNTKGKLQGNKTETVRHLQAKCKNTQVNYKKTIGILVNKQFEIYRGSYVETTRKR